MSTGTLPARRSARAAARLLAAAGDDAGAAAAAAPAPSPEPDQPRKRQRKAASVTGPATEDVADVAEATHKRKAGRAKAAGAAAGPTRELEREKWQAGFARVAGVDEAGRGPLAGPVVAAACVVPEHVSIEGIDDSKKMSAEAREAAYEQLTRHPDVVWAAKVIEAEEIDSINILQATMKAMEGAAAGLPAPPDFLFVDGNRLPKGFDPSRAAAVVKGDSKSVCIAAASVIAKVTRDRLMLALHAQYPAYNFGGHKGYCVPEHVEAIRRHGPCPQHRRTFAPVKTWFPLEPAEQGAAAGKQQKKGGGSRKAAARKGDKQ